MKKWWWILIVLCAGLNADAAQDACQAQIKTIDAEVQKLEVQKQKHIDLARQYQAEGDQWQYDTGRIDDAYKAWGQADRERARAIEYQRQIDVLLEQKERIYQYYPILRNQ